MVSVTISSNEKPSVSLKTNGNMDSETSSSNSNVNDESIDINLPENDEKCSPKKNRSGSLPQHSSEVPNQVTSPRTSRIRRQPKKFKDFDSNVLNPVRRSPEKNQSRHRVVSNSKLLESESPKKNTEESGSKTSPEISALDNDESEKEPSKPKEEVTSADTVSSLPAANPVDPNGLDASTPLAKGTIIWAKVFFFPYWPCMIIPDPETKQHYKHYESVRRKSVHTENDQKPDVEYSYHVRFFGPKLERGWTKPKLVRNFESGDMYLNDLNNMIDSVKKESQSVSDKKRKMQLKKKLSSIVKEFGIKSTSRDSWNKAVMEAESALALSNYDKLEKYEFKESERENLNTSKSEEEKSPFAENKGRKSSLDQSPIKKAKPNSNFKAVGKKRQKKASADETFSKKPKTASPEKCDLEFEDESESYEFKSLAEFREFKKQDTSVLETSSASDQEDVYQFSAKPKKVSKSFKVFSQKIRPKLKVSHRGASETELSLLVEKLWNKMSSKQQMRYKTYKSDDQCNESVMTDSPHRKSAMKIKIGKFGKFEASVRSSIQNEETQSDDDVSEKKFEKSNVLDGKDENSSSESIVSQDSSSDDQNGEKSKKYVRKSNIPSIKPYEDQNGSGESVCMVCEEPGSNLLPCKGQCNQMFHEDCVSLSNNNDYTCVECLTGTHKCFICKKQDAALTSCSVNQCGKFYHNNCLKRYPSYLVFKSSKGLTCPLHSCLSCVNDNVDANLCKSSKSKLIRCIKCPIAYHKSESCIGAGCLLLTQSLMICHDHFLPQKGNGQHTKVNVNWCFICSDGGSLICCDSCPAAFHADCLNIDAPEGNFYCDDCVDHRQPRYRNIVWVKFGNYRWWPAAICVPSSIPTNVMNLNHSVGEFPVKFFGSHDYLWIHRGRVFLFHEGDKGSKYRAQNSLVRVFNKAVIEATEAFKEWCSNQETRQAKVNEKINQKPNYKHIKVNKPFGKIFSIPSSKEQPICECDPSQEHPCGDDSTCMNRMMMIECNPTMCHAGERCENQRFEKKTYPDIAACKTSDKGWGLHCRSDLKKGQFVIEYVGEIIDEAECKKRIKQMNVMNNKKFYFLTLDKDRIIDAGPKGNSARFMNHCCQPNCETQKWTINGHTRVGLFSLEDIPAFTELNFNYNLQCLGDEKIVCACGAPNCSGLIGVPPKALPSVPVKKKKLKKRKKLKVVYEDQCFRCGDGGDLVLCDRKGCAKCYHLNCLNLDTLPPGKWICPWHHCDECGKSAVKLCSFCPNSFCRQHSHEENVQTFTEDDTKIICHEHDEFISK